MLTAFLDKDVEATERSRRLHEYLGSCPLLFLQKKDNYSSKENMILKGIMQKLGNTVFMIFCIVFAFDFSPIVLNFLLPSFFIFNFSLKRMTSTFISHFPF